MNLHLDIKDKKILFELEQDSRQSNSGIARKVGLSKDAVGYRIRKLEKKRMVRGYYTLLNVSKLGLATFRILLKFRDVTSKVEKEMIEYLRDCKNVGWLASCDGNYDLAVNVWARNAIAFDVFFSDFLKKYSTYLKERVVVEVMANHTLGNTCLLDKEHDDRRDSYYNREPEISLDDIDLKIVKCMANDSRVQLRKLAGLLKLSGEAIAYRIKRMKSRGVIQAYRPIVDPSALGYTCHNVLFRLKKFDNANNMLSFFKKQPNIVGFAKYLGSYDIGIDIEVKDISELRGLLEQIRNKFGKDIESYDSISMYKEHKLSYAPEL